MVHQFLLSYGKAEIDLSSHHVVILYSTQTEVCIFFKDQIQSFEGCVLSGANIASTSCVCMITMLIFMIGNLRKPAVDHH
jgi:hypothetical protein